MKKQIFTILGAVSILIFFLNTHAKILDKSLVLKNTSVNKKIAYDVQKIIDQPSAGEFATSRNLAHSKKESKVQVYVSVDSTGENQVQELVKLGLEIEIINSKLNKIQGWLDVNRIDDFTSLDNVMYISTPSYGHRRVGSRLTAGDSILLSNLVRQQGFTGEGVKVGIISDGSAGLALAQASGDLPNNVTLFDSCVVTFSGSCSEGTAMAEIIHDIAPDAELAIADALTTTLEFIQRLDQLANEFNADIIVDDLGFLIEPYFEDGDISDAVNALPDNIVYISAAGNDADEHYQASFNADNTFFLGSFSTLHDFGRSTQSFFGNTLPINVAASGSDECVFMQWNDEYTNGFDGPGAVNDHDLWVFNEDRINFESDQENLIGSSLSFFNTIEVVCFPAPDIPSIYHVVVQRFSGVDRDIEMFFTGGISINDRSQVVAQDSIFGHPASERAIAVGTINAEEPNNDLIASFSSQGPVQINFPVAETRQKPEITGIDGVSVTGSGGFSSFFFGTSAAAPHIAGITALLKSARPNASRVEIEQALLDGAIDLGSSGVDNVYGTGRANALNSLNLILDGVDAPAVEFDILDFLPAIIEAAKRGNN